MDAVVFAYKFYGIKSDTPPVGTNRSAAPFAIAMEDLVSLTFSSATALLKGDEDVTLSRSRRDVLLLSSSILDALASRLDDEVDGQLIVSWDPDAWLSTMFECLEQRVRSLLSRSCAAHNGRLLERCVRYCRPLHHCCDQTPPEGAIATKLRPRQTVIHYAHGQSGV